MTAATRDTRAQRTPGPWAWAMPRMRKVDGYQTDGCAISANGEAIALAFAGHRDTANAAYIVRACNSHDALVDALRAMVDAHSITCSSAEYDKARAAARQNARALLSQFDKGECT